MSIKANVYTASRRVVPETKLSATVTTANTVGAFDPTTGVLIEAVTASLPTEIVGIILESKSAADAATSVAVELINKDFEYIADSVNNSNAAWNGNRMLLATSGTVTNTSSDVSTGQVVQVGVVGAASDKKILVKFV